MRFNVYETDEFRRWLTDLRDREARAKILVRLRRLSLGNCGDVRRLRGGLLELRVDYGPGYRVYALKRGSEAIVVLAGGDKRTQRSDIERSRRLAETLGGER